MPETKIKICVVSISLAKGGAERSTAILTKMLQNEGFEVHLALLTDEIDYEYAGQLFNLGELKTDTDYPWKRFKRIRKLRNYLKMHDFDFIIDNRTRQSAVIEYIYLKYVYHNLDFIYVIHSRNIEKYLTRYDWVGKQIIKKSHKIVGVAKSITESIKLKFKTNKALTIYNSVDDFDNQEFVKENNEKYILFLGRIDDEVKNFSLLMEAYRLSKLPQNNIALYLVGDGPDKGLLTHKINSEGMQNHIKQFSFTPNVYPILKNALFLTLTSKYEGFPMVLIEALSAGIPVVSVNCESGPSEIIQHEVNGLLVENHHPKVLAEAFDRFLTDKELYRTCKSNSQKSVSHLNQKNVVKQWIKILRNE